MEQRKATEIELLREKVIDLQKSVNHYIVRTTEMMAMVESLQGQMTIFSSMLESHINSCSEHQEGTKKISIPEIRKEA